MSEPTRQLTNSKSCATIRTNQSSQYPRLNRTALRKRGLEKARSLAHSMYEQCFLNGAFATFWIQPNNNASNLFVDLKFYRRMDRTRSQLYKQSTLVATGAL